MGLAAPSDRSKSARRGQERRPSDFLIFEAASRRLWMRIVDFGAKRPVPEALLIWANSRAPEGAPQAFRFRTVVQALLVEQNVNDFDPRTALADR